MLGAGCPCVSCLYMSISVPMFSCSPVLLCVLVPSPYQHGRAGAHTMAWPNVHHLLRSTWHMQPHSGTQSQSVTVALTGANALLRQRPRQHLLGRGAEVSPWSSHGQITVQKGCGWDTASCHLCTAAPSCWPPWGDTLLSPLSHAALYVANKVILDLSFPPPRDVRGHLVQLDALCEGIFSQPRLPWSGVPGATSDSCPCWSPLVWRCVHTAPGGGLPPAEPAARHRGEAGGIPGPSLPRKNHRSPVHSAVLIW